MFGAGAPPPAQAAEHSRRGTRCGQDAGTAEKSGESGPWGVVGAIEGGQAAGAYTLKHAGTLSDRLLRRDIRAKDRRKV